MCRRREIEVRLLGAGRLGFLEVVLKSLGFGEVGEVRLSIRASGVEKEMRRSLWAGADVLDAGNSAEGCQGPEIRVLWPQFSTLTGARVPI